jgi:hypothetical protein
VTIPEFRNRGTYLRHDHRDLPQLGLEASSLRVGRVQVPDGRCPTQAIGRIPLDAQESQVDAGVAPIADEDVVGQRRPASPGAEADGMGVEVLPSAAVRVALAGTRKTRHSPAPAGEAGPSLWRSSTRMSACLVMKSAHSQAEKWLVFGHRESPDQNPCLSRILAI